MNPEFPRTVRRIKRFAPLQLGKIMGILYAAMGLLFVPFILLISAVSAMVPQKHGAPPAAIAAAFSLGFAFLMPVFYGVMGFLTGVIGAFFYNLVAKWIGGIEVEVE